MSQPTADRPPRTGDETPPALSRKPAFLRSVWAAVAGVAVAGAVTLEAVGEGWGQLPLWAGAAGFGTWYGVVEYRASPPETWRWVLRGGLAGAVAHYPAWLLMLFAHYVCYRLTGGCTGSLGEPPIGPFLALGHAALLSGFSLLFVGLATVPLGATLGYVACRQIRRRAS